eukprot:m.518871 g.518871  ORF g.518871 m.518871 type:complete len:63 (-) comp135134_c0_seq1:43-231(-)
MRGLQQPPGSLPPRKSGAAVLARVLVGVFVNPSCVVCVGAFSVRLCSTQVQFATQQWGDFEN